MPCTPHPPLQPEHPGEGLSLNTPPPSLRGLDRGFPECPPTPVVGRGWGCDTQGPSPELVPGTVLWPCPQDRHPGGLSPHWKPRPGPSSGPEGVPATYRTPHPVPETSGPQAKGAEASKNHTGRQSRTHADSFFLFAIDPNVFELRKSK